MDLLCFCSGLCLLCLCARLFICALWSPAVKGLTSWLSFVVSNCDFVTFPLVSWVRCGTNKYSTRGDQKVCGKLLLKCIAFIECNENS